MLYDRYMIMTSAKQKPSKEKLFAWAIPKAIAEIEKDIEFTEKQKVVIDPNNLSVHFVNNVYQDGEVMPNTVGVFVVYYTDFENGDKYDSR